MSLISRREIITVEDMSSNIPASSNMEETRQRLAAERQQRELQRENNEHKATITRQQVTIDRQQAEIQRLNEDNSTLKRSSSMLQDTIDRHKSENARLTAENAAHKRDIASLSSENDRLRATVARHETAIDGLKTRNMTLKSTVGKQKLAIITLLILTIAGAVYGLRDKLFGGKSHNPQIPPEETARQEREQSFRKQAEGIYADFADRFGAFVNAGAVEAFDIAGNASDSWRGKKVFPAEGSSPGIISREGLVLSLASSLLAETLEVADNGSLFQADISQSASFIPGDIIRSSFMPSSTLKPSASSSSPSQATITNDITDRLKSGTGSYGYARFILRTSVPNVSLMAAYSLDPYAPAQCRTFLVLGGEYVFADSRRLRDIEDSIRARSDINAAVFTMKAGSVSKADGLTGCLRKLVDGFAE